jgi:hypothetical protein
MNQPSNTPPDGDFARYIEQLAGSSPLVTHEDMRQPAVAMQPGIFSDKVAAPVKPALAPFAGIAFARHLRWLIAVWIATQLLTRFVPQAGFLIIPVLMGYAAWLIVRINQNLGGTLVMRFRELAAKAEAAGKNSGNSR